MTSHQTLNFEIIDDLRQLLSSDSSSPAHTPRHLNQSSINLDTHDQHDAQSEGHLDSSNTYRLRRVPTFIRHEDIKQNLLYYGHIVDMQNVLTSFSHK